MTTVRKRAQLYLGWRWRQARGCAGRTAVPTKTIGVAEVLRVPSDRSCSAKQEKQHYKYKISAEPPLHGEISKTCKKEVDSMADNTYKARWPHIHNPGTKATHPQFQHEGHTSTIPARRPHIHNSFSMLTWPYCYSYSTTPH
jgi:hypothetical protein